MKSKLLIFAPCLLFLTCCSTGESIKLDKSLKATIKENDCLVSLKSVASDNQKEIYLTTQCSNESVLFYGKIMFDFVMNSIEQGLEFDYYSINSISNQQVLSFSNSELEVILEKKKLFDQLIIDFYKKDIANFLSLLDSTIHQDNTIESLKSKIESILVSKQNSFEGLAITSEGGNKYVSFSQSISSTRRVLITFLLDVSDNTIFGYTIE